MNFQIQQNVGRLDRALRIATGIILLPSGLFWLGGLEGELPGIIAAVVGVIALATGVSGFCLLYIPFGIDTAKRIQSPPRFSKRGERHGSGIPQ